MIKDYISQALLHLMQKKAYSQITIQEITVEAGGESFHLLPRNFTSKETIIQHIFGEIIDKFDAYAGSLWSFLCPAVFEMFHHFYKHQKTFLIIHKPDCRMSAAERL